jgi:hypothetical protein
VNASRRSLAPGLQFAASSRVTWFFAATNPSRNWLFRIIASSIGGHSARSFVRLDSASMSSWGFVDESFFGATVKSDQDRF